MRFSPIIPISVALFFGCEDKTTQDTSSICAIPVAEAGSDQAMAYGQPITLDGSASSWCDSLSENIKFNWSFASVPSDSLINDSAFSDNRSATAITPSFAPDAVGEYVIALQLDDSTATSNEDFVVVSVEAGDLAPSANCGGSYSGKIGELLTIDGSGSADPEGYTLTYEWSLSGPACSALTDADIYNGANASPSFVPDCDGVFIMTLVVSDGSQWSDPAICSVDVASNNRMPTASAGSSQEYGGCAPAALNLNGLGSYDLDGDPITYEWSVVSVPTDSTVTNANISNVNASNPTFSWDLPGVYTFQLQVYDGELWSAPDVVSYVIGDITQNNRPIANAGDNQQVSVSGNCEEESSYSSASCSDCPETSFVLNASESIDPNGDSLTYLWSEESGALSAINGTLVSTTAAMTDVIVPPQAASTSSDTTFQFEFSLIVSDCERSDDDTVTITYVCSGN
ncbi:MAG: REJ domain-containing protein [Myxococcota bacterium]|nr:REJ domain-containing protein [Myxococcota bacterium]